MCSAQDQIINPELEHRRMQAIVDNSYCSILQRIRRAKMRCALQWALQEQMAADSAAMFRRMSFDRGGDSAGASRCAERADADNLSARRVHVSRSVAPVTQAGSGTGEEQQDEQMGEGKVRT